MKNDHNIFINQKKLYNKMNNLTLKIVYLKALKNKFKKFHTKLLFKPNKIILNYFYLINSLNN